MRCRRIPAWSYWRSWEEGGRVNFRRARWKDEMGYMGSFVGWVGALKALWEGGFLHMSVPGGAERVKGGMVVVVVFGDWDIVVGDMDEKRMMTWESC